MCAPACVANKPTARTPTAPPDMCTGPAEQGSSILYCRNSFSVCQDATVATAAMGIDAQISITEEQPDIATRPDNTPARVVSRISKNAQTFLLDNNV